MLKKITKMMAAALMLLMTAAFVFLSAYAEPETNEPGQDMSVKTAEPEDAAMPSEDENVERPPEDDGDKRREGSEAPADAAYAVLLDEECGGQPAGTLVFIRSSDSCESGPEQSITDITGAIWRGYVYSGIETGRAGVDNCRWFAKRGEIIKAVTLPGQVIRPENTSYWFAECSRMVSADLEYLDTEASADMSMMFAQCYLLEVLRLEHFKTDAAVSMEHMFYYCVSLASLDLGSFNTSAVTDMTSMFEGCLKLEELNVESFDTAGVVSVRGMFCSCEGLKSLDISSFDTLYAVDMKDMFTNCPRLVSIKLGQEFSFKGSIAGQPELYAKLPLPETDGRGGGGWACAEGGGSVFSPEELCESYSQEMAGRWCWKEETAYGILLNAGCNGYPAGSLVLFCSTDIYRAGPDQVVTDADGSLWRGRVYTDIEGPGLTGHANSRWFMQRDEISRVVTLPGQVIRPSDTSYWFYDCRYISSMNLAYLDTSLVSDMKCMFMYSTVTELDISNFNTQNVTDMRYMFYWCTNLKSLDLSHFDTGAVTDMYHMFYNCRSLTSLNVSSFDTHAVTDMSTIFFNCSRLTELDLSSFDTSAVTDMANMFHSCARLTRLDLSSFDTSAAADMGNMFQNCPNLTSITLGPGFTFAGNGIEAQDDKALFPAPPVNERYTGQWIKNDKTSGPYTPEELRDEYTPAMSGAWIWEELCAYDFVDITICDDAIYISADADSNDASVTDLEIINNNPYRAVKITGMQFKCGAGSGYTLAPFDNDFSGMEADAGAVGIAVTAAGDTELAYPADLKYGYEPADDVIGALSGLRYQMCARVSASTERITGEAVGRGIVTLQCIS